ncbi:MAG: hypothetical protein JJU20_06210 [Opitutales bacterium]|nr:hypothetical protein [Opitutales bacterium]
MNGKNFNEVVQLIRRDDPRYELGAYHFIRQALDYTLKKVREADGARSNRHVSGMELSEGIRDFALEQYGPMSRTLLKEWGIERTEDFGEIVFNLVEYEVFGKTEDDRKEDFVNVFDFADAFDKPFLPNKRHRPLSAPQRGGSCGSETESER